MRKITILFSIILALTVNISATTLTVTKNSDSQDGVCNSDCSLREAINNSIDGDTIIFDEVFFNTNRIIELTLGELNLTKNLTILGTGANKLTIKRSTTNGTELFRIFYNSSVSSISNLTISEGKTENVGGGILNAGNLTLSNVEIRDNTAFVGGGIYNNGTLTLLKSTISNNTTSGGAAGIDNPYGSMTIENTTISNNQAGTNGGGIINIQGTAILRNVTVAFNTATAYGGGILNDRGTVSLGNVLVANNSSNSGQDIYGLVNSDGYNFIENINGGTIAGNITGNIIGVDPQLDPTGLNVNNGSTRTIALQLTSPAIDKGNRFGANSDQRGVIRPNDNPSIPNATGGDGSDIGAFEVNNSSASRATFSGQVLSSTLRGVTGAIVSLTSPNGEVRFSVTNPFGYFSFQNVPAGIIYTLSVRHKRYTFSPRDVAIISNSSSFNSSIYEEKK
jgi:CSLREA domain-containing protein